MKEIRAVEAVAAGSDMNPTCRVVQRSNKHNKSNSILKKHRSKPKHDKAAAVYKAKHLNGHNYEAPKKIYLHIDKICVKQMSLPSQEIVVNVNYIKY